MKHILSIFLLLTTFVSHGQTGSVAGGDPVYQAAEQMPQAGYDINEYLSNNLRYPDSAGIKGIQGRVIVRFVVNKDGSIDSCSVKRGIGGGCDEEALRVLKAMPPWKPGMQNGQPVRVSFSMPVKFAIDTSAVVRETQSPSTIKSADGIEPPMPEYDLNKYLMENGRYPEKAKDVLVSGNVVVAFVVETDGYIGPVKVWSGVGYGCSDEAVRLIKKMPRWTPCRQNGKKVRVEVTRVIKFTLGDRGSMISENTNAEFETAKSPTDVSKYISKKVPLEKYQIGEKGGVFIVVFDVDINGKTDKFSVTNGINPIVDKQVVEAIKSLGPWIPAKNYGVPVNSTTCFAIKYTGTDRPEKFDDYESDSTNTDCVLAAPDYSMAEYLFRSLRYPDRAREEERQGTVMVSFIIDIDGTIGRCKVVSPASADLNREALRVIESMPRWKPGTLKGVPVPQIFSQKISFRLD